MINSPGAVATAAAAISNERAWQECVDASWTPAFVVHKTRMQHCNRSCTICDPTRMHKTLHDSLCDSVCHCVCVCPSKPHDTLHRVQKSTFQQGIAAACGTICYCERRTTEKTHAPPHPKCGGNVSISFGENLWNHRARASAVPDNLSQSHTSRAVALRVPLARIEGSFPCSSVGVERIDLPAKMEI